MDDAGHLAYVVGGSVRDFLLKRETKDHDIATSATPDELCNLFPHAVTVGKAFGVLKIPIPECHYPLEIASFRQDLGYEDFRHPKGVILSSPLEDARRRDFTINGLFYDPKTSRILDAVGGMEDLKSKILRAIGNPFERLREDALRLIRAVRFTTTLGFSLDPHTVEAVRARAKLITKVSTERIRDELTLMWTGPNPGEAMQLLSDLGLTQYVFPELETLRGVEQSPQYHPEGDVWKHTIKVMECLTRQNPVREPTLAWGALLHDIGKPIAAKRSEGENFNGHEIDGSKIAARICSRLKMSRHETDLILSFIEDHLKFKDVFQMRESTLKRFIRQEGFEQLLALHKADASASDGNLAFHEFCMNSYQEYKKMPPTDQFKLISGRDLIQLGLLPGPRFSEILKTLEDLALERKLKTKEEALEYVVKHFVG